jgi:hypothetical protein
MKILAFGREIRYDGLDISCEVDGDIGSYDYIIISGGDGTIRRTLKLLYKEPNIPPIIINPTGSFNVIAKLHRVSSLDKILDKIANGRAIETRSHQFYTLNSEVFLFSAGNMGDLQHILLSETLRFGLLSDGIFKYILAVLFLLPIHIVMTPFMLLSSQRFFIFTPFNMIGSIGSFYGRVESIDIDLQNHYNLVELDGDVVMIDQRELTIQRAGEIDIVV